VSVRGSAFTQVVAWGGGAALVAAAVIPERSIARGPVLCPFRLLTGLPCPGCGLTRSWVGLAHGDFGAAFANNLVGPLLAVGTLVFVVAYFTALIRRRPVPDAARLLAGRPALVGISLWLFYGAIRIGWILLR
jgi:hypothetical protein